MYVTIDNYREGAEVRFTPSAYRHYVTEFDVDLFKSIYNDILRLPSKKAIYDFMNSTCWVNFEYDNRIQAACISERTHIDTYGYFLEYVESNSLINDILGNLEILEKRYG